MSNRRLWLSGGVAGIFGICCYVVAVAVPWPETQLGTSTSLAVISVWPLLSIFYWYALTSYVAVGRESVAGRLGLVFAVAAFSTLLAMVVVQLAVGSGIGEIARGLDPQIARALRRGLRLVDLGLDVTWDILISAALLLTGVAMRRRAGLGAGWAIPSIAFGIALFALNIATFPWPPATRGLFDIGPAIAAYFLLLSVRLAFLGARAPA